MLEIFEWLNNIRNNDQNYFKGVKLLEKYNSTHPLLEELKQKISSINKVYLKQALKKTYESLKTKPAPEPKQTNTIETAEPTNSDAWKAKINKDLSKLYRKRRELSNSFHDCSTDIERAYVSDQIKNIIETIQSHKARLMHFSKKGEMLPPPKPKKSFKVPDNDLELIKLRNSLRSRISIKKRTIEIWQGDKPRKKTKAQHQFDLVRLQKELNIITQEIATRGI